MIILKVTKSHSFTLFLKTHFWKKHMGVKLTHPTILFRVNNYQPDIEVTFEINPENFRNSKICYNNSSITTNVHGRVTKLTLHWSSSIPKRYKRNAIHGDLCGAERISRVCFLLKIRTLNQRAKFIKERVLVMRHILMKPFGILAFDGMSMRTYVRNLNLQSI